MTTPLQSLIASGTKLWLDTVEATLMAEGIKKSADPMKVLLALIAGKRKAMSARGDGPSQGTDASPVMANQETG